MLPKQAPVVNNYKKRSKVNYPKGQEYMSMPEYTPLAPLPYQKEPPPEPRVFTNQAEYDKAVIEQQNTIRKNVEAAYKNNPLDFAKTYVNGKNQKDYTEYMAPTAFSGESYHGENEAKIKDAENRGVYKHYNPYNFNVFNEDENGNMIYDQKLADQAYANKDDALKQSVDEYLNKYPELAPLFANIVTSHNMGNDIYQGYEANDDKSFRTSNEFKVKPGAGWWGSKALSLVNMGVEVGLKLFTNEEQELAIKDFYKLIDKDTELTRFIENQKIALFKNGGKVNKVELARQIDDYSGEELSGDLLDKLNTGAGSIFHYAHKNSVYDMKYGDTAQQREMFLTLVQQKRKDIFSKITPEDPRTYELTKLDELEKIAELPGNLEFYSGLLGSTAELILDIKSPTGLFNIGSRLVVKPLMTGSKMIGKAAKSAIEEAKSIKEAGHLFKTNIVKEVKDWNKLGTAEFAAKIENETAVKLTTPYYEFGQEIRLNPAIANPVKFFDELASSANINIGGSVLRGSGSAFESIANGYVIGISKILVGDNPSLEKAKEFGTDMSALMLANKILLDPYTKWVRNQSQLVKKLGLIETMDKTSAREFVTKLNRQQVFANILSQVLTQPFMGSIPALLKNPNMPQGEFLRLLITDFATTVGLGVDQAYHATKGMKINNKYVKMLENTNAKYSHIFDEVLFTKDELLTDGVPDQELINAKNFRPTEDGGGKLVYRRKANGGEVVKQALENAGLDINNSTLSDLIDLQLQADLSPQQRRALNAARELAGHTKIGFADLKGKGRAQYDETTNTTLFDTGKTDNSLLEMSDEGIISSILHEAAGHSILNDSYDTIESFRDVVRARVNSILGTNFKDTAMGRTLTEMTKVNEDGTVDTSLRDKEFLAYMMQGREDIKQALLSLDKSGAISSFVKKIMGKDLYTETINLALENAKPSEVRKGGSSYNMMSDDNMELSNVKIPIDDEMKDPDMWENIYENSKHYSKIIRTKLSGIENNFVPDEYNVYHGTNTINIDAEGNLILKPSLNFAGKTNSISFSQIPGVALDYMFRKNGNKIIKLSNEVLGDNYTVENDEEIAINTDKEIIVPKGKYKVINTNNSNVDFYARSKAEINSKYNEYFFDDNISKTRITFQAWTDKNHSDWAAEFDDEPFNAMFRENAPDGYMSEDAIKGNAARKALEELFPNLTLDEVINDYIDDISKSNYIDLTNINNHVIDNFYSDHTYGGLNSFLDSFIYKNYNYTEAQPIIEAAKRKIIDGVKLKTAFNPEYSFHSPTQDDGIPYFQDSQFLDNNNIDYQLKAIANLDQKKAVQEFNKLKKGTATPEQFAKSLGIPQEQVFFIKEAIRNNPQSLQELQDNLIANTNFPIVMELSTEKKSDYDFIPEFQLDGNHYQHRQIAFEDLPFPESAFYLNGVSIRGEEYYDAQNKFTGERLIPTQKYLGMHERSGNDGGINYIETAVRLPGTKLNVNGPSHEGDFNKYRGDMMGWVRSDDLESSSKIPMDIFLQDTMAGVPRIKRILEMQSNLMQKYDDNFIIYGDDENPYDLNYYTHKDNENTTCYFVRDNQGYNGEISKSAYQEAYKQYLLSPTNKNRAFLNNLAKDKNWVPVFAKSIIQDSQKKGYDYVLFPRGETAAKEEGHGLVSAAIRDFKENIENNNSYIENLKLKSPLEQIELLVEVVDIMSKEEEVLDDHEYTPSIGIDNHKITFDGTDFLLTPESYVSGFGSSVNKDNSMIISKDRAIELIQSYKDDKIKELEEKNIQNEKDIIRYQTEGLEKLAPIEGFYEVRLGNWLGKNYPVETIVDEYGNGWFKVKIEPERDSKPIYFQDSQFLDNESIKEDIRQTEVFDSINRGILSSEESKQAIKGLSSDAQSKAKEEVILIDTERGLISEEDYNRTSRGDIEEGEVERVDVKKSAYDSDTMLIKAMGYKNTNEGLPTFLALDKNKAIAKIVKTLSYGKDLDANGMKDIEVKAKIRYMQLANKAPIETYTVQPDGSMKLNETDFNIDGNRINKYQAEPIQAMKRIDLLIDRMSDMDLDIPNVLGAFKSGKVVYLSGDQFLVDGSRGPSYISNVDYRLKNADKLLKDGFLVMPYANRGMMYKFDNSVISDANLGTHLAKANLAYYLRNDATYGWHGMGKHVAGSKSEKKPGLLQFIDWDKALSGQVLGDYFLPTISEYDKVNKNSLRVVNAVNKAIQDYNRDSFSKDSGIGKTSLIDNATIMYLNSVDLSAQHNTVKLVEAKDGGGYELKVKKISSKYKPHLFADSKRFEGPLGVEVFDSIMAREGIDKYLLKSAGVEITDDARIAKDLILNPDWFKSDSKFMPDEDAYRLFAAVSNDGSNDMFHPIAGKILGGMLETKKDVGGFKISDGSPDAINKSGHFPHKLDAYNEAHDPGYKFLRAIQEAGVFSVANSSAYKMADGFEFEKFDIGDGNFLVRDKAGNVQYAINKQGVRDEELLIKTVQQGLKNLFEFSNPPEWMIKRKNLAGPGAVGLYFTTHKAGENKSVLIGGGGKAFDRLSGWAQRDAPGSFYDSDNGRLAVGSIANIKTKAIDYYIKGKANDVGFLHNALALTATNVLNSRNYRDFAQYTKIYTPDEIVRIKNGITSLAGSIRENLDNEYYDIDFIDRIINSNLNKKEVTSRDINNTLRDLMMVVGDKMSNPKDALIPGKSNVFVNAIANLAESGYQAHSGGMIAKLGTTKEGLGAFYRGIDIIAKERAKNDFFKEYGTKDYDAYLEYLQSNPGYEERYMAEELELCKDIKDQHFDANGRWLPMEDENLKSTGIIISKNDLIELQKVHKGQLRIGSKILVIRTPLDSEGSILPAMIIGIKDGGDGVFSGHPEMIPLGTGSDYDIDGLALVVQDENGHGIMSQQDFDNIYNHWTDRASYLKNIKASAGLVEKAENTFDAAGRREIVKIYLDALGPDALHKINQRLMEEGKDPVTMDDIVKPRSQTNNSRNILETEMRADVKQGVTQRNAVSQIPITEANIKKLQINLINTDDKKNPKMVKHEVETNILDLFTAYLSPKGVDSYNSKIFDVDYALPILFGAGNIKDIKDNYGSTGSTMMKNMAKNGYEATFFERGNKANGIDMWVDREHGQALFEVVRNNNLFEPNDIYAATRKLSANYMQELGRQMKEGVLLENDLINGKPNRMKLYFAPTIHDYSLHDLVVKNIHEPMSNPFTNMLEPIIGTMNGFDYKAKHIKYILDGSNKLMVPFGEGKIDIGPSLQKILHTTVSAKLDLLPPSTTGTFLQPDFDAFDNIPRKLPVGTKDDKDPYINTYGSAYTLLDDKTIIIKDRIGTDANGQAILKYRTSAKLHELFDEQGKPKEITLDWRKGFVTPKDGYNFLLGLDNLTVRLLNATRANGTTDGTNYFDLSTEGQKYRRRDAITDVAKKFGSANNVDYFLTAASSIPGQNGYSIWTQGNIKAPESLGRRALPYGTNEEQLYIGEKGHAPGPLELQKLYGHELMDANGVPLVESFINDVQQSSEFTKEAKYDHIYYQKSKFLSNGMFDYDMRNYIKSENKDLYKELKPYLDEYYVKGDKNAPRGLMIENAAKVQELLSKENSKILTDLVDKIAKKQGVPLEEVAQLNTDIKNFFANDVAQAERYFLDRTGEPTKAKILGSSYGMTLIKDVADTFSMKNNKAQNVHYKIGKNKVPAAIIQQATPINGMDFATPDRVIMRRANENNIVTEYRLRDYLDSVMGVNYPGGLMSRNLINLVIPREIFHEQKDVNNFYINTKMIEGISHDFLRNNDISSYIGNTNLHSIMDSFVSDADSFGSSANPMRSKAEQIFQRSTLTPNDIEYLAANPDKSIDRTSPYTSEEEHAINYISAYLESKALYGKMANEAKRVANEYEMYIEDLNFPAGHGAIDLGKQIVADMRSFADKFEITDTKKGLTAAQFHSYTAKGFKGNLELAQAVNKYIEDFNLKYNSLNNSIKTGKDLFSITSTARPNVPILHELLNMIDELNPGIVTDKKDMAEKLLSTQGKQQAWYGKEKATNDIKPEADLKMEDVIDSPNDDIALDRQNNAPMPDNIEELSQMPLLDVPDVIEGAGQLGKDGQVYKKTTRWEDLVDYAIDYHNVRNEQGLWYNILYKAKVKGFEAPFEQLKPTEKGDWNALAFQLIKAKTAKALDAPNPDPKLLQVIDKYGFGTDPMHINDKSSNGWMHFKYSDIADSFTLFDIFNNIPDNYKVNKDLQPIKIVNDATILANEFKALFTQSDLKMEDIARHAHILNLTGPKDANGVVIPNYADHYTSQVLAQGINSKYDILDTHDVKNWIELAKSPDFAKNNQPFSSGVFGSVIMTNDKGETFQIAGSLGGLVNIRETVTSKNLPQRRAWEKKYNDALQSPEGMMEEPMQVQDVPYLIMFDVNSQEGGVMILPLSSIKEVSSGIPYGKMDRSAFDAMSTKVKKLTEMVKTELQDKNIVESYKIRPNYLFKDGDNIKATTVANRVLFYDNETAKKQEQANKNIIDIARGTNRFMKRYTLSHFNEAINDIKNKDTSIAKVATDLISDGLIRIKYLLGGMLISGATGAIVGAASGKPIAGALMGGLTGIIGNMSKNLLMRKIIANRMSNNSYLNKIPLGNTIQEPGNIGVKGFFNWWDNIAKAISGTPDLTGEQIAMSAYRIARIMNSEYNADDTINDSLGKEITTDLIKKATEIEAIFKTNKTETPVEIFDNIILAQKLLDDALVEHGNKFPNKIGGIVQHNPNTGYTVVINDKSIPQMRDALRQYGNWMDLHFLKGWIGNNEQYSSRSTIYHATEYIAKSEKLLNDYNLGQTNDTEFGKSYVYNATFTKNLLDFIYDRTIGNYSKFGSAKTFFGAYWNLFAPFVQTSMYDSFTGLMNREKFHKAMRGEIAMAGEDSELAKIKTPSGYIIGDRLLDFKRQRRNIMTNAGISGALSAGIAMLMNKYLDDDWAVLYESLSLGGNVQNNIAKAISYMVASMVTGDNPTQSKKHTTVAARSVAKAIFPGVGPATFMTPLIDLGMFVLRIFADNFLIEKAKNPEKYDKNLKKAWENYFDENIVDAAFKEVALDKFSKAWRQHNKKKDKMPLIFKTPEEAVKEMKDPAWQKNEIEKAKKKFGK